jgi:Carboxypeptidase regulatory-like domain
MVDLCRSAEVGLAVLFSRLLIILASVAACAVLLAVRLAAKPASGIEGAITIAPWHAGPVRVDEPSAKPLANATFVVQTEMDTVASEFTTDAQGRFRVSLAPGRYKVSLKNRSSSIGKYGPFEVDVTAGRMTTVQWQCDSGMR